MPTTHDQRPLPSSSSSLLSVSCITNLTNLRTSPSEPHSSRPGKRGGAGMAPKAKSQRFWCAASRGTCLRAEQLGGSAWWQNLWLDSRTLARLTGHHSWLVLPVTTVKATHCCRQACRLTTSSSYSMSTQINVASVRSCTIYCLSAGHSGHRRHEVPSQPAHNVSDTFHLSSVVLCVDLFTSWGKSCCHP